MECPYRASSGPTRMNRPCAALRYVRHVAGVEIDPIGWSGSWPVVPVVVFVVLLGST